MQCHYCHNEATEEYHIAPDVDILLCSSCMKLEKLNERLDELPPLRPVQPKVRA